MNKKKLQNGFTMIELIAVLVLIGILSAYAVPKFLNITDDAKKKAASSAYAAGVTMVQHATAKVMLSNGGTRPASTDIIGATKPITATTAQKFGDYCLSFDNTDATKVTISAYGLTTADACDSTVLGTAKSITMETLAGI